MKNSAACQKWIYVSDAIRGKLSSKEFKFGVQNCVLLIFQIDFVLFASIGWSWLILEYVLEFWDFDFPEFYV